MARPRRSSTSTILVYLETDPGVQVGDTVTVIGSTKTYALAKEFVQDTVVTVTGHTEVASKEPQKLTGEQIDALLTMEQIDPIYVEVSGMLFSAEDGQYYNMFIYGTTLMGSLTYPDASLKATLDSMEYENVTVIGYVTGIVNDLYVNIMVDRIV